MGLIIDKISGNSLFIDIKEADLDASLIAKINSNKNTIPAQDIAMQYFDGTRVGNEFIDKGIQGLNLDIIDNDIELTSGFPYKSAAKIKQKATSFGLIPNPNLFWFQADGTPNEIPVVSLFQNIDYANQIFTRHAAQQVDGNGVETYEPRVLDIVTYASALTGDNLTLANAYYKVPVEITSGVKWVDAVNGLDTNAGTKAAPWKTLTMADVTALETDTVYVKTGVYLENSLGLGYYRPTRSISFKGIGRVMLDSTGTTRIITNITGTTTFERFIIGSFTNIKAIYSSATVAIGLIFNKCYATYLSTSILDFIDNNTYRTTSFVDSMFIGKTNNQYNYIASRSAIISGCYFKNMLINQWSDATISNCKFYNDLTNSLVVKDINVTINDCKFSYAKLAVVCTNFTGTKSVEITNSVFYNLFTIAGSQSSAINLGLATNVTIENNYFNSLITTYVGTAQGFISLANCKNYSIQNNISISKTNSEMPHISISFDGSHIVDTCYVKNNYSHSESLLGFQINISTEQTQYASQILDGQFTGNHTIGSLLNYPSTSTSLHGLFIGAGKNYVIAYNLIEYAGSALVAKSLSETYTSGGMMYNLVNECLGGIAIEGITGMNCFNNTVKNQTIIPTNHMIRVSENPGMAGTQNCENIICKNNIYENKSSGGIMISIDTYAAAHGCAFTNEVVYGSTTKVKVLDGLTYATLELAQAAGFLADSVEFNPNLDDDLIPAAKVEYAVDLGTDYDDGLDVTSDFGSETVTPVIVTKQQAATWQNGAYII